MSEFCKIYFLSFADKRYSLKRIRKEALSVDCFDEIVIENEDHFETWYKLKYKKRFLDRGFGYWQWKSYRIRRLLEQMNENDVLVYVDAGCHINPLESGESFKQKLLSYIEDNPIALFQGNSPEYKWTKGDIYDFFSSIGYKIIVKNQLQAGIIILRKNFYTTQLMDNWFYICHNRYDLINDDESLLPNCEEFIENRHDQSILSLLANQYPCSYWPLSEIYTNDDWGQLKDKPIWLIRRKEENVHPIKLLKRRVKSFLKRVIKK